MGGVKARGPVLGLALALALVAGCGSTKGSGVVKTESRTVSGFEAVRLEGSGDVTITQTGSESLTIEADDNILPKLTSDVVDGTLVLGVKKDETISPSHPIKYTVTVAKLTGIALAGSGNIDARPITTGTLSVDLSGSGNTTVQGQAMSQAVSIAGSGNYRGQDFATGSAKVDISGSGSVTVRVQDTLDVRIAGSGSVTYYGDPKVTQNVSGSGSVQRG